MPLYQVSFDVITHTPSEHRIHGLAMDLELQIVHVIDDEAAAGNSGVGGGAGGGGQGPNRYLIISVLLSTSVGPPAGSPAFLNKVERGGGGRRGERAREGQ